MGKDRLTRAESMFQAAADLPPGDREPSARSRHGWSSSIEPASRVAPGAAALKPHAGRLQCERPHRPVVFLLPSF